MISVSLLIPITPLIDDWEVTSEECSTYCLGKIHDPNTSHISMVLVGTTITGTAHTNVIRNPILPNSSSVSLSIKVL